MRFFGNFLMQCGVFKHSSSRDGPTAEMVVDCSSFKEKGIFLIHVVIQVR